ncbi:MAG TPA: glycosyltransferase family 4 protein [Candidatus Bathyarchaeia archaeon]|nr:glycosyltransferase family 4 protein [Candidatus Bathyarchaeia archaeon]
MKICITSPYVYPSRIGGAEKYVSCLARSLTKTGTEVIVLTSKHSKLQTARSVRNGIETVYLNPWVNIGANPLTPRLFDAIKRERPNIIHMQAPTLYGDFSTCSGRLLRIPVVATFHGCITKSSAPGFLLSMYNVVYPNFTLNHCDRVIVTTRQNMWLLEQMGLKKEVLSVVPVGVERSFIDSSISTESEDEFSALISKVGGVQKAKLLFAGALDRHHAYKGLENLLAALKLVVKARPDVLLIVVGDGDRRAYYETLAKDLGIGQNVLFTGWVSDELLLTAYSRSDLFVLPSRSYSEGFGIVLLEAMSRGCPVLTTAFAGGAEAVRDAGAGIVVENPDPVLLSNAIMKFVDNQDYAGKCGRNGMIAVDLKYTWDIVVERILNIYKTRLCN